MTIFVIRRPRSVNPPTVTAHVTVLVNRSPPTVPPPAVAAHATVFVTPPPPAVLLRVPVSAQSRTGRASSARSPALPPIPLSLCSPHPRGTVTPAAREGAKTGPRKRPAERAIMSTPSSSPPPRFSHERLDAYQVAREALAQGDAIARDLPRGYATLADQLRRALLSAFLGVAEAAARSGADRLARFRCARGETSQAAAALDAVVMVGLAPASRVQPVLVLLGSRAMPARANRVSMAWSSPMSKPRSSLKS